MKKLLLFLTLLGIDVLLFQLVSPVRVFQAPTPVKPPSFVMLVSPRLQPPPPPPIILPCASDVPMPNAAGRDDLPDAAPASLIALPSPQFAFNAPKVTLANLSLPKRLTQIESTGLGNGLHQGSGKITYVNGNEALRIAATLHGSRIGVILDASSSMMTIDFENSQPNPIGTVAETIIRNLHFDRLELSSSCSIIGEDEAPETGCVLERSDITSLPGFHRENPYPTDINDALQVLESNGTYDTFVILTDLQDDESPQGLAKLQILLKRSKLVVFTFDQPGKPELNRIVRDSGGEIYHVNTAPTLATTTTP